VYFPSILFIHVIFFEWSNINWLVWDQTFDLVRIKVIKAALSDTAYYPIIKIRVKSLSIHPGIFRVHLYPLSFRNLHAHLNSHFACVRGESFLASYYPVSVSSALRRRPEDSTKNSLPPNLFPTRPRLSSLDLLTDPSHPSLRGTTIGWWTRSKTARSSEAQHNFDFELKKLGEDEEWWP